MSHHGVIECSYCEGKIHLGDARVPGDGGPIHEYCGRLQTVTERYHLFENERSIPGHDEPVKSFSLYYIHNESLETPVLVNTGGASVFHTCSSEHGEGRQPVSRSLIESIAFGYQESMAYTEVDPEALNNTINMIYDENNQEVTEIEKWAIHHLVSQIFYMEPPLPPELGPLVEFVDYYTAWRVPAVEDFEIKN